MNFDNLTGVFLRIRLSDGSFGYARIRKFPYIAFYAYRTIKPVDDLDEIASNAVLFTLAAHKSILNTWEVIGQRPLETHVLQPVERFTQDAIDCANCKIVDLEGNERIASPNECIGLERVAVWEPNHIEDRLIDTFMNRPNKWLESMKVNICTK